MESVNVLIAIPDDKTDRYHQNLSTIPGWELAIVSSIDDARGVLSDLDQHTDVLVVDNALADTFDLIGELRTTYPRLLIITVDEEADFGLPGMADDISTEPFGNNDLAKRINRLMTARRTETLRSDSLPAVREFAKALRTASSAGGKQQAAVETALDMGYDYVAYYHLETADPPGLSLKAQAGPNPITSVAPKEANADDLMTWVARSKQSRIANYGDEMNHPLVAKGRLGAGACIPVTFDSKLYGVLVACRDKPNSITQENVMMLELVGSQLAAAILKENSGG